MTAHPPSVTNGEVIKAVAKPLSGPGIPRTPLTEKCDHPLEPVSFFDILTVIDATIGYSAQMMSHPASISTLLVTLTQRPQLQYSTHSDFHF